MLAFSQHILWEINVDDCLLKTYEDIIYGLFVNKLKVISLVT